MLWILFLGLHLVGLVGYNLLLRKEMHAGKIHPWVLASLLQTGIMAPIIIALPFLSIDLTRFTISSIIISSIVVALTILLLIASTKALQYLEASTYAVIYGLRIIVTTMIAAIILTELPTGIQIAGGLLVLAGIVIVRQKTSQHIARQGVVWGVVAAVAVSFLNVFEKQLIQDVGIATAAPVIMITTSIIMWSVVAIRRYNVSPKEIMTRQMIFLIGLRSLAAWGLLFALATGALVSVTTFISSMSVVLIVLLGILLLGERDYIKRKIVAVGLTVIGLIAVIFGA